MVASLAKVMQTGVDVRGYLHWSLFDNFEWVGGYRPTFGLVGVDRSTRARTLKPGALAGRCGAGESTRGLKQLNLRKTETADDHSNA